MQARLDSAGLRLTSGHRQSSQNTSSKDRYPVLCVVRTGSPKLLPGGWGGPGTPSSPPRELASVRLISIGLKKFEQQQRREAQGVDGGPRSLPLYFRAPETLLSLPRGRAT